MHYYEAFSLELIQASSKDLWPCKAFSIWFAITYKGQGGDGTSGAPISALSFIDIEGQLGMRDVTSCPLYITLTPWFGRFPSTPPAMFVSCLSFLLELDDDSEEFRVEDIVSFNFMLLSSTWSWLFGSHNSMDILEAYGGHWQSRLSLNAPNAASTDARTVSCAEYKANLSGSIDAVLVLVVRGVRRVESGTIPFLRNCTI